MNSPVLPSPSESSPACVPPAPHDLPGIDRVVSLMPGFVYVFNHVTYSNDYVNRSIGVYLGYTGAEIQAMGSQMLMQVVHPEDQAALGAHMARIAQLAGEDRADLEYRVLAKDGTVRWLRSIDTVFDRGPNGQVLRHIGCASDITAQKDAQERLAQLNAELEEKVARRTFDLAQLNLALEDKVAERTVALQEAVEELEQLTYVATHDLKVPVNNLNRLGLMLQDGADQLSAEQAEQVAWVSSCAEQLSSKIQGLVLVAQIRLSTELPFEAVPLATAVKSAINSFRPVFDGIAVRIVTDVPEDLIVRFVRFEADSIINTLLDNAIKYADPDRPLEIEIAAHEIDGVVALSIKDNGLGVETPRDEAKVFGLFQRAHKEPPGSGISLYCARRMLQRRGGTLAVSGTRGEGAEFTITFPNRGTA